jgi:hypothetical protein
MPRWKVYWPTSAAALVVAGAIAVAANAAGMFVEPGVQVLHEFDGTAQSSSFGWAVSELGDVDGDHVKEAIVGEPSPTPAPRTSTRDERGHCCTASTAPPAVSTASPWPMPGT